MPGKALALNADTAGEIAAPAVGEQFYAGDSGLLKPLDRGQTLRAALLITAFTTIMAVSEYIFAYRNVAYGILACLGLAFLMYTFLVLRPVDQRLSDTLESLTLIPLYVLFTSSLPWFFINQNYLLPAVYSCIIGLCLFHVQQRKIDLKELFGELPEKRTLLGYGLAGLGIGAYTGMVEYFILRPEPFHPEFSPVYLVQNTIYMLFFVGLGEELLFRGLIQRNLSRLFNWRWGLFMTSLLFSIMHLTWRSVPELFFVFVAGAIFGGLYIKTKSLYLPIIVHGVNNTFLVAVYPYLLKNIS